MAIRGTKPKPDDQKVTRHPLTQGWTEVQRTRFGGGPKIPPYPVKGQRWHRWTRKWWEAISAMPHCSLWEESDWQFAFATLLVADAFYQGDLKVAKELRDRERKLGMTLSDQRDQRIRYVQPPPEIKEEGTGVTSLADYRQSLNE